MKKNIINQVQKQNLRYRLLILFLACCFVVGSQDLTKTYSDKILSDSPPTIEVKGPLDFGFAANGRISSFMDGDDYVIIPGGNDGVRALVVRDFEIKTTDSDIIEQSVTITVIPDERYKQEAIDLLEALESNLQLKGNKYVTIDGNLNIVKFGFENGFFRKNVNTVELEDGKKFRIKSLVIESEISIPKSSTVNITADYLTATIGDLSGELNLNLAYSKLRGNSVGTLNANLNYSKVNFTIIDKAELNTQNSGLRCDAVQRISIGKGVDVSSELYEQKIFSGVMQSRLSTYNLGNVGHLSAANSVNDQYFMEVVKQMDVKNAAFTDFEVGILTKELTMEIRKGDLHIKSLAEGFEKIMINNEYSDIYLKLQDCKNYAFEGGYLEFTEMIRNGHELKAGNPKSAGKITINCKNCRIEL